MCVKKEPSLSFAEKKGWGCCRLWESEAGVPCQSPKWQKFAVSRKPLLSWSEVTFKFHSASSQLFRIPTKRPNFAQWSFRFSRNLLKGETLFNRNCLFQRFEMCDFRYTVHSAAAKVLVWKLVLGLFLRPYDMEDSDIYYLLQTCTSFVPTLNIFCSSITSGFMRDMAFVQFQKQKTWFTIHDTTLLFCAHLFCSSGNLIVAPFIVQLF